MKKDWGRWTTAGVLSSFALVMLLTGCESTPERSPGERQAMGERREGLTPTPGREGPIAPAPEAQKAPEPEKEKLPGAKQEKGPGGVAG